MMSQLSKLLRDGEGGLLFFWCPGCDGAHSIRHGVDTRPCWTWNGDVDKPTFTPSILVTGVEAMTDDEHATWMRGGALPAPRPMVCHSFVADGRIQFLGDCTHKLANQTVDLPDWDE